MKQTIESRVAHKNKTGKWPDHPGVVPVPEPEPPRPDVRLCPACKEPLVPNPTYDMKGAGNHFAMVCTLCGCNPY